jgi:hypothetical protein
MFDACLEIVWHNDLGYTAKESEHADVGTDPAGQVLTPVGLGIGIVAGTQYADEYLGLADLAGVGIDDGSRLTGIVHEDFLSTFVGEAHRGL